MAFECPNVCLPMCQIGFKSLVCRTASQMIVWSPNMGSLGSAVFGNVYPVVLRDGHSCCCWHGQMAEFGAHMMESADHVILTFSDLSRVLVKYPRCVIFPDETASGVANGTQYDC